VVPGAGVAGDVNNLVWSKDPYELQDLNRARLTATGASEAQIAAYLDHAIFSPTLQTLLTGAIAAMEDVPGRAGILSQALNMQTEVEARFFVHATVLLGSYHVQRNALSRVVAEATIPLGIVGSAHAVLVLPVDKVYWTDSIAEGAAAYEQAQPGTIETKAVHFLGGVSKRCRAEIESRGWQVIENVSLDPETT
jgi:hypothetical protein